MTQFQTVAERLYPEIQAGGFSRDDHRIAFLIRLHAVLEPWMTVLDLGAGRGKWQEDPARFRAALGDLRGKCRRVVGADIDPIILQNEIVDDRILLDGKGRLPFPDNHFDIVTAFSVLEHIENPQITSIEIKRVLKPGGWFIAWTPNRFGYVGLGAQIVPRRLHQWVLHRLEPNRETHDSFPPLYRLNTKAAFRQYFPPVDWQYFNYTYNGQPQYYGRSVALAWLWLALFSILPPALRAYWMIILRRRPL